MKGVVAGLVMVLSALAGFRPGKTTRAVPAVYVFGDSSLDVGNNNYLPGNNVPRANKPFHGVDFPGPGRPRPTGRFSNGYNVADFIGKLSTSFNRSYQILVINKMLLPMDGCSQESGVREEPAGLSITEIASSSDPNCCAHRSKLCFCRSWDSRFNERRKQHPVVEAGRILPFDKSGDGGPAGLRRGQRPARRILLPHRHRQQRPEYLIQFATAQRAKNKSATQSDVAALYGGLISNYSAAVTDLYMMGARKIGVINAGLSGCLPMVRAQDAAGTCNDAANELAAGFNGAQKSFLADLAPRLPGLAYSLADGFAHRRAIIGDPQAEGFVSATSACCGSGRLGGDGGCLPTSNICSDRDAYIYWDWVHAAQRAAKIAAEAFFHGPNQFTTPLTFKQLAEKEGTDLLEQ